ncbi:MAG: sulfite exporter TauE/SafE family protein [Burkholderiales bacterium]|nr:sulfite exporter TauE/SafE family protein [Burkholderiales bacterium]
MLGFDAPTLAWIALVSLAAFAVRGLCGFGSSMIGIGALAQVLPPARVVPAFLALELLTSVNLVPGIWRRIDWRSLRWVVAGCALATPAGVMLLAHADARSMRLGVSACLLAIALAMLGGLGARMAAQRRPGGAGALAVGLASGLLNGAAGIGGPPAVVFYFANGAAAVGRATLIAFFLFTDVYALAWAGAGGLLGRAGWPLLAVALPFALAGIGLGSLGYQRLDEARLKRAVWILLATIGAIGLASGLWSGGAG